MEYLIHILILIAIYAVLNMSLNLVVGYTGLLSLAHGAFFGVGAYSTAVMMTKFDYGFFTSVLLGCLLSGLIALLSGLVLSRFRDDYFALASLGLNFIIYSLFLNLEKITNGPLGIPNIPRIHISGIIIDTPIEFFILFVIIFLIIYIFLNYLVNSPFGLIIKSIRENEVLVQVFGGRTITFKLAVFIIGAVLAAIAGSCMAAYFSYVDPTLYTFTESIFILSGVILGGLASLEGSIVGAAIMILLPEILRFFGFPDFIAGQMRQMIYGFILVALMFLKPQGLLGKYKL